MIFGMMARKMTKLDETLAELEAQRKKFCKCGHIFTDHVGYGRKCIAVEPFDGCLKFEEREDARSADRQD